MTEIVPRLFKRVRYFCSGQIRQLVDGVWTAVPEESDPTLEVQVNAFLTESYSQLDGSPTISMYPETLSPYKHRLFFMSAVVYLPPLDTYDYDRTRHGEEDPEDKSDPTEPEFGGGDLVK